MFPKWYQIAKDFQTLIAALVALLAAIVAYLSAQQVAKKQIVANRDTDFKRQISLTAALLEWANTIDLKVSLRLLDCGIVIDRARIANADQVDKDDPISVPRIQEAKSLGQELSLANLTWEDTSILSIEAQSIYHRLIFCIQTADQELADIQQSFTLHHGVPVIAMTQLVDAYKRLQTEAKGAYVNLEKVLRHVAPRYRSMAERESF